MTERNRDGPHNPKKQKDYVVGHGKPPKEYQWSEGQCGNPKGRPAGAMSFDTEVKRLLKRKVPIKVNGTVRKVTVVEANFERLLHKAMAGDTRAITTIMELARHFLPEDFKAFEEMLQEDREILNRLLERKGPKDEEESDGNT